MKPTASMKAWAPQDRPDLLLLLNPNEAPPRTPEAFLLTAARTLALLVSKANPKEVELANNLLNDQLPEEFKLTLPAGLLSDPKTPRLLYLNPAPPDSNLAEWRNSLPEAFSLPSMPKDELNSLVEQTSLESYLSPLM